MKKKATTARKAEPKAELLVQSEALRVLSKGDGKGKAYFVEVKSADAMGAPKWDQLQFPPDAQGRPSPAAVVLAYLCGELDKALSK